MNQPSRPALTFEEASAVVRASLDYGLTLEQIPPRLVARGLTPAEAQAMVDAVLEGRARSEARSEALAESAQTIHRAAAGVAVVLCLGFAFLFDGIPSVARTVPWLLLPVACVWFAEAMSAAYDGDTPVRLVRWGGWLALLAILGYRVVLLALAFDL